MDEEKFIVTPNAYTQEQWCEMYLKVVEIAQEQSIKINRAIEYLDKHTNNEVEYLDIIEVKELKNILEGSDKE